MSVLRGQPLLDARAVSPESSVSQNSDIRDTTEQRANPSGPLYPTVAAPSRLVNQKLRRDDREGQATMTPDHLDRPQNCRRMIDGLSLSGLAWGPENGTPVPALHG